MIEDGRVKNALRRMLFNHDGGMMKKCAYVPGGVARGYKNIQGH